MSDVGDIRESAIAKAGWCDRATLVALLAILAFAAAVRVRYANEFASFDELWNLALATGHAPLSDSSAPTWASLIHGRRPR